MNRLVTNALRRKMAAAEAAGDKARAKLYRERIGEADEVLTETPEDADGLEGVPFASPVARAAAEEAGLTAESFKRRRKSSEGGFTKGDVERLAAATDEGDEGTD
jgi:hypothetical protein